MGMGKQVVEIGMGKGGKRDSEVMKGISIIICKDLKGCSCHWVVIYDISCQIGQICFSYNLKLCYSFQPFLCSHVIQSALCMSNHFTAFLVESDTC